MYKDTLTMILVVIAVVGMGVASVLLQLAPLSMDSSILRDLVLLLSTGYPPAQ